MPTRLMPDHFARPSLAHRPFFSRALSLSLSRSLALPRSARHAPQTHTQFIIGNTADTPLLLEGPPAEEGAGPSEVAVAVDGPVFPGRRPELGLMTPGRHAQSGRINKMTRTGWEGRYVAYP